MWQGKTMLNEKDANAIFTNQVGKLCKLVGKLHNKVGKLYNKVGKLHNQVGKL